jgi:hypothetical protein
MDYKGYQIKQASKRRVHIYKDGKMLNYTDDMGSAKYMIDSDLV